ncbi:MAG: DUF5995 family protein [Solirubrobacterales bacterium]
MLACAAAASAAIAAPARAENVVLPNWPSVLPAAPGTPAGTVPLGWDSCPRGQVSCVRRVIREMTKRWRPIDQSCDHRAVFALTYLRTTEEFLRTIEGDSASFADPAWVNHLDAVFAELYFRAYDSWEAGGAVPEAWRIAFETAASDDEQGIGDLMLGMNAHINRDLPYALAHVGLLDGDGAARKADHDRVNEFLDRVIDPLQIELARLYDPIFALTDGEPSPLDEVGALAAVRGFRENAWRNAERLVRADTAAERALVSQSIEAEAALGARTIQLGNAFPGYGPSRDAHCAAAH